jgi:hypothetical protein
MNTCIYIYMHVYIRRWIHVTQEEPTLAICFFCWFTASVTGSVMLYGDGVCIGTLLNWAAACGIGGHPWLSAQGAEEAACNDVSQIDTCTLLK